MSNHPTTTRRGPWRLLILDPGRDDPKWVLATVAEPGDVRPATVADEAPEELTTRWVAARAGLATVELTPVRRPRVWLISEHPAG